MCHSPDRVFELPELHPDGCARPCLVGIVLCGFRIAHTSVHNVQFQPRGGTDLVSAVGVSEFAQEIPDITTGFVLCLKSPESCNITLHTKAEGGRTAISLHLRLQWLMISLVRFAFLFALLNLHQVSVNEVCLNNMPGDLLHELGVVQVPDVQDLCNADNVLTMHFDGDIGRMVGLIIACLVTGPELIAVNLLLSDVSFDFANTDCLGPF